MDIKSAFLQSKPIEREVFLKPLKEDSTNKVWELNTTVYGLCDAPRTWYLSVKEELINTGGVKSRYDDTIFYWHKNQLLQGILLSHEDDFSWSRTEWFKKNIIDHIREKFAISKEETQVFRCLGLNITHKEDINLYSSE